MTDTIKNGGKKHSPETEGEAPIRENESTEEVLEEEALKEPAGEKKGGEEASAEGEENRGSGDKKSFYSKKHGDKHSKDKEAAAKLAAELEEAKAKEQELRDRYIRLSADFDNFRKRSAKENEAKYLDAKADTLKQLLPVVDSFERAAAHEADGGDQSTEGYRLIYSQLKAILEKNGVEEIKALGETFNPNLHYAVMHVEDDAFGPDTVCEVFEKGYRMGDRILRFSTVKVAN